MACVREEERNEERAKAAHARAISSRVEDFERFRQQAKTLALP